MGIVDFRLSIADFGLEVEIGIATRRKPTGNAALSLQLVS